MKKEWIFMLSMVIFGTMAPFVRQVSVTSGELALYRAVLALLLIGPIQFFGRQKITGEQQKKALPLLLLSGAAMGFNWLLLFQAYNYTTVSVATLSYYFAPVLVTVLCPILFKEKMKPINWLCSGFSTLGIILLTGLGDPDQGQQHLIGICFGLGAAVLYASVMILNKYIKDVPGLQRTFFQFLAAALVLAPYVLLTDGITLGNLDATGWVCLLILGLVHSGLNYCMYFSSIKSIPGQKAAILSYLDPLVAVVISVTVLQEAISVPQIIGGCLILGFTLLNELKN